MAKYLIVSLLGGVIFGVVQYLLSIIRKKKRET